MDEHSGAVVAVTVSGADDFFDKTLIAPSRRFVRSHGRSAPIL